VLLAVYGAAQQEFKEVFLTELVHACSKEELPILLGVILISLETQMRKTMRDMMTDGPFFSILSLMA
jgi:hypothetical protein